MKTGSSMHCTVLVVLAFSIILGAGAASEGPRAAVAAATGENLGTVGSEAGAATFPDGCLGQRVLRETIPPMRGEDVAELQRYLKDLNLFAGPVDGVYGAATRDAVKALQARLRVPVTGEYDPVTWTELEGGMPVGTAKAESPGGRVEIVINLDECRLTVYSDGAVHKNYTVAIGKPITPSPVGEFRIISKGVMEGPAFGSRWLGLNVPWGVYGIHGTNMPWLIGDMVSQGCLRMFNRDVEELYSWVEVGTPVTIIGDLSYVRCRDILRRGYSAQDVVIFQKRLREKGFYEGRADGDFGPATEAAVRAMQAYYGLEQHGVATPDLMALLGLP